MWTTPPNIGTACFVWVPPDYVSSIIRKSFLFPLADVSEQKSDILHSQDYRDDFSYRSTDDCLDYAQRHQKAIPPRFQKQQQQVSSSS